MAGTNWVYAIPDWGTNDKVSWVYGVPMWDSPQRSASGAQNVSLGFASRTAAGYSPTVKQTLALGIASRTAAGYAPALHQQVRPDPALRTAAGYAPSLHQQVRPDPALRTAAGYELSFSTSVTLALGSASRTAAGYDPALHQQVRPGFALRMAAGYSPTLTTSGGGSVDPAAVWAYEILPGLSAGMLMRGIASVHLGKSVGHPYAPEFSDPTDDSRVRVSGDLDQYGNRSNVVLDLAT